MRTMRIMVMFDLPVVSPADRKVYAKFRNFLIKDGYVMDQFSVYSRITLGRDNLNTHIERLKKNLPSTGAVTVFAITNKQYEDRMILVGNDKNEPSQTAQLTLSF